LSSASERRTHDYARHGISSLFAAFSIADGTVISELRRRLGRGVCAAAGGLISRDER
jgi:hypothetical protein